MLRRLAIAFLVALAALPVSARALYDTDWVEFSALGDFDGEAVQLSALQFRPRGAGPFPAIVLLHGCGGMYTPSGYITA
jgi:poly(3-hydroxybutyrate) depolymerase